MKTIILFALFISFNVLADPPYEKLTIDFNSNEDAKSFLLLVQKKSLTNYFKSLGISDPENLAKCIDDNFYYNEAHFTFLKENAVELVVTNSIAYYEIKSSKTFEELLKEFSGKDKTVNLMIYSIRDHYDYNGYKVYVAGNVEFTFSSRITTK